MEMGRSIAANILGGGYAASALDQRSGRVLVECAGAISPEFSGELDGQAVWIVAIRGTARCSMPGRVNGGFLRFLGWANPLVAWPDVAWSAQATDLAPLFGGCQLIASFRTGQRRAAGRGVASSLRAREGGGGDPLAGARASDLPRRADVPRRQAIFADRSAACLPCWHGSGAGSRRSPDPNGVGGLGGTRSIKPVGKTPNGSNLRTGRGAKRLCVPGGLRKPATLGGGRNRVN